MKVCVFGTRGFPLIEGGVEKHCELLYPLLGKDIEIVVFRRKSYVNNEKQYSNIKFIDLPSTRIKGIEAVIHSFLATIWTVIIKPDVVHIHNIGPALFTPLLKLLRIPVVLTYHSANYEHKKWGRCSRRLLLVCEHVALKYADKIIFVNRFQMEKYSEKVQRKSVYIPNGIVEHVISQNNNYLKKIGVEVGKFIFSIGRITPEKGFDTLIKAFKEAKLEGYKLVIAGGVEFESGYMKILQELSKDVPVVFTGYVFGDDLAQLYTNAALYVLPSNNEGFPLVLLEAMSYGLDVLVSDIPATHLVKLEKDDYFPRENYIELSKHIKEKMAFPKHRKYDLKEYNWSKIAEQVLEIFEEVKL